MGDKKAEIMKIHYIFDNWTMQYRLNLRNKMKTVTEIEKKPLLNI